MDPLQVGLLLFRTLIHKLLLLRQSERHLFKVLLLLLDLGLKPEDLIVILRHRLLQLHVTRALLQVNIGLQALDFLLDGVKVDFFDQYFVGRDYLGLGRRSLLGQFILVFDAEAGEDAVDANREKLAVVVVKTHSFDLLRVSLDFNSLAHHTLGVTENLNAAWPVRLRKTGVDERALVANKDLRVGQVLFVPEQLLFMGNLTDATILSRCVDKRL